MGRIVTVTPNPLLDFVADHALEPGRVGRCDRLRPQAEGKGVNVARVLARHGHAVEVRGFAGGFSGAWFRSLLAPTGVTVALTETAARLRCGFLAAGSQPPTALMEDGFAVAAAERDLLVADLAASLPGADLVICSGSVPDATCLDLVTAVLAACAEAGVSCWLDAYGPAMARALAAGLPLALVKPNAAEHLAGGPWEAATELHLTDGERPVRVRRPGATWELEPPAVRTVNPVGSGDCYLAGLAHARLAGWDEADQLRYACAAGAANAERVDVAELDPARIESLASAVRVRKLAGDGP